MWAQFECDLVRVLPRAAAAVLAAAALLLSRAASRGFAHDGASRGFAHDGASRGFAHDGASRGFATPVPLRRRAGRRCVCVVALRIGIVPVAWGQQPAVAAARTDRRHRLHLELTNSLRRRANGIQGHQRGGARGGGVAGTLEPRVPTELGGRRACGRVTREAHGHEGEQRG